MLFAGLAASAAIDLLSLLQAENPKGDTALAEKPSFSVADPGVAGAAAGRPQAASAVGGLSRETLEALLSAQGQQAAQRKKRSMSVLLDLLQSSQNGSVGKATYEAATANGDGETTGLFDRIDRNGDHAVNIAELAAFLDSYRRRSDAATAGRARALAVIA